MVGFREQLVGATTLSPGDCVSAGHVPGKGVLLPGWPGPAVGHARV